MRCPIFQTCTSSLLVLALYLWCNEVLGSYDVDLVVETKQGKLLGEILRSRKNKDYLAFKGVPFGEVTVRFEAAEPASSWTGIRDATNFGPVCPQLDRAKGIVKGEEDCLYLNVYAPIPSTAQLELFPVAVFFHGGAFMFGTGSDYGGSYLTDEGVILVTVNYRLGALGFLSTGDSVIQGNYGLKDQRLALIWIQENIKNFGGDPNRVTLMGTSAGAASVSFHVISPMSTGLFHRAQGTSGSVLNAWSIKKNPKAVAQELAEQLYCPQEPSEKLAECLREMDYKKIVQINLAKWYVDPLCQYAPVVEVLRENEHPKDVFLSEDPYNILSEGRFNKVPMVLGVAEDEGLLFHSAAVMKIEELQRNMNENWNEVAPITFLYHDTPDVTSNQLREISRTIRGYYFGQRKVDHDSWTNLTNLYSDRYFFHGVKKQALIQAKYTLVYPFILGFQGDWSIVNLYYGDTYKDPIGVSHGDDLQYLFDSQRFPPLKPNSKSDMFSKALVRLFASFIKTGNVMESIGFTKFPWLPVGPEEIKRKKIKWYSLEYQPKVLAREPFTERLAFWDSIEEQLERLASDIDKDEL